MKMVERKMSWPILKYCLSEASVIPVTEVSQELWCLQYSLRCCPCIFSQQNCYMAVRVLKTNHQMDIAGCVHVIVTAPVVISLQRETERGALYMSCNVWSILMCTCQKSCEKCGSPRIPSLVLCTVLCFTGMSYISINLLHTCEFQNKVKDRFITELLLLVWGISEEIFLHSPVFAVRNILNHISKWVSSLQSL